MQKGQETCCFEYIGRILLLYTAYRVFKHVRATILVTESLRNTAPSRLFGVFWTVHAQSTTDGRGTSPKATVVCRRIKSRSRKPSRERNHWWVRSGEACLSAGKICGSCLQAAFLCGTTTDSLVSQEICSLED